MALLARAYPNLFTAALDLHGRPLTPYDYIRHHLPLAQGNALLHAHAILEGNIMIWPDPKLSKRGRWWLKVKQLWKSNDHEGHD